MLYYRSKIKLIKIKNQEVKVRTKQKRKIITKGIVWGMVTAGTLICYALFKQNPIIVFIGFLYLLYLIYLFVKMRFEFDFFIAFALAWALSLIIFIIIFREKLPKEPRPGLPPPIEQPRKQPKSETPTNKIALTFLRR